LENKAQREAATTLKQVASQLANAQAAVSVRSTEGFNQLAQSQEALYFFALG
jgi:hypothetical protein